MDHFAIPVLMEKRSNLCVTYGNLSVISIWCYFLLFSSLSFVQWDGQRSSTCGEKIHWLSSYDPDIHWLVLDTAGQRSGDCGVLTTLTFTSWCLSLQGKGLVTEVFSPCHQLVFNTAGQRSGDWGVLTLSPARVWRCRAKVRWLRCSHPVPGQKSSGVLMALTFCLTLQGTVG